MRENEASSVWADPGEETPDARGKTHAAAISRKNLRNGLTFLSIESWSNAYSAVESISLCCRVNEYPAAVLLTATLGKTKSKMSIPLREIFILTSNQSDLPNLQRGGGVRFTRRLPAPSCEGGVRRRNFGGRCARICLSRRGTRSPPPYQTALTSTLSPSFTASMITKASP